MLMNDASTNLTEDSLEYKIPKMTVNIKRRKSYNDDNTENCGCKLQWLPGSSQPKNIAKVEVSYQNFNENNYFGKCP